MKPPPKDGNGLASPHDHDEILNGHRVIRGVSNEFVHRDKEGRPLRLSSALLEPSSANVDPYCGLSVDIEQLMLAHGIDAATHASNRHFLGSIAFTVNSFRSRNFLVGYDPLQENPCHGGIWQDAARGSKLTRGTKMSPLREATWYVAIDGIPIVS
jgi:hypothetical protein